MKNGTRYRGVVVPMVTPVRPNGSLDETATDRLVDLLLANNVEGIFVLGTTGEGAHVPCAMRLRLLECVHNRVHHRALLYAGLGDLKPSEFAIANQFLRAGADVVVAHPPITHPVLAEELLSWYLALLKKLDGSLILYNIPATTGVSIPLNTIERLATHPRVIGVKDSENDAKRLAELLQRLGRLPGFSIFIGVGALMAQGLRLGADGIVPSVGNLIPGDCHEFWAAAECGDWALAENCFARMNTVATLYQKGRTLPQSLAALKAALHHRGLCSPDMLPPLTPVAQVESESLRCEMARLQLLR